LVAETVFKNPNASFLWLKEMVPGCERQEIVRTTLSVLLLHNHVKETLERLL
jgi:hypothetical protein